LNPCRRKSNIPLIVIAGKICCNTVVSAGDSLLIALGQYSAKFEDDYSVFIFTAFEIEKNCPEVNLNR
jgi:hypothetical protein